MINPNPMPNPVPAAVPPISGPVISYSVVRSVINNAQSLEKQLDKKIRDSIATNINHAAGIGAGIEARVLNRINDRLEPVKSTLDNTEDLVRNSIAGQMAPAAAYLQDVAGGQPAPPAIDTRMGTAEPTGAQFAGAVEPFQYMAAGGVTPAGAVRTGVTRQPSLRQSGIPTVSPFVQPCANPPDAAINAAIKAIFDYNTTHPNPPLPVAYHYYLDPNCCLFTLGEGQESDPRHKCSIDLGIVLMSFPDKKMVEDSIVKALKDNGVAAAKSDCTASCSPTGGVDCVANPLDASCPPDCKTHPEDQRCPPTPPTCPPPCSPPCIEVNVPPCPPCPPLDIPQCIQIDLCDWDKFCKFLTDCLVKSKEDCALDNDTAYTYKDCDGKFGEAQQFWLGSMGDSLQSVNSLDELATAGQALSTAITADEFGPIDPY